MKNPYLIMKRFSDIKQKEKLESALSKIPIKIEDPNNHLPLLLITPYTGGYNIYRLIPLRKEGCELTILEQHQSIYENRGRISYYFKIADAENYTLKCVDECNLEHPKVPNKLHTLVCGKRQGLFDFKEGGRGTRYLFLVSTLKDIPHLTNKEYNRSLRAYEKYKIR